MLGYVNEGLGEVGLEETDGLCSPQAGESREHLMGCLFSILFVEVVLTPDSYAPKGGSLKPL